MGYAHLPDPDKKYNHDPKTLTTLRRTKGAPLREIIEGIERLHADLGAYYAAAADQALSPRARMFLEFMAAHELAMTESLQDTLRDTPDNTLSGWFKYTPEIPNDELLARFDIRPDMTVDEVAENMMMVHNTLSGVYEPLKESAGTEDLRQEVEQLMALEREHASRAWRAASSE